MYRTNAQSRVLEDAFVARGMPYRLVGGTRFYQRKEIKDALAYLRLVHNPADNIALGRVINVPPRAILVTKPLPPSPPGAAIWVCRWSVGWCWPRAISRARHCP